MRNFLFVLAIAGLGLSGCVVRYQRLDEPPQQTKLSKVRIELPATFVNNRPYVDLKINGKGPYLFLVDTGAFGTIITSQVARDIGITRSKKYIAHLTGSSGDSENQSMTVIKRIESPGFSLRGVAVTIMTPGSVDLLDKSGDRPVGGIIGISAFGNVLLEIDYPQKEVSIARPEGKIPSLGAGIPFTGLSPKVTITTPSLKHATAIAVIDTGDDSGIGLAEIADYPVRVGLVKADGYQFGLGGYRRALFGQLAGDIRLGTAIWRDPPISSANRNVIGGKALASWKMVIDQKNQRLWLLDENQIALTTWDGPLEPDGRPPVFGFAAVPDGDALLVKEVDSNSRAEKAGLKIGDRIVMKPGTQLLTGMDQGGAKNALRLNILRGSEKLEISLSLAEPMPPEITVHQKTP